MKKGLCITLALILALCGCALNSQQPTLPITEEQSEMRRIVSSAYFSYIWNNGDTSPAYGTITLQTDAEKAAYTVFYTVRKIYIVDGSQPLPKDACAEILKKTLGLTFSGTFAADEWLTTDFYARDYDAVAFLDYVDRVDETLVAHGILCEDGNFGLGLPRHFEAEFQYINGTLQLRSLTVRQTAEELSEEI